MAKRTPPGPDADQSDWVDYAMATDGIASYDAWALSFDELRAQYGPAPDPTPDEPAKPKHKGA